MEDGKVFDGSGIQKALKVFSIFIDDLIVILLVLLVLPKFGVSVPPLAVAALAVVLISIDTLTAPLLLRDLKRRPTTGREGLVGMRGKVVKRLDPEGYVRVRGELWRASSASGSVVDRGATVRVVGVEGSVLIVDTDDRSGHNN
ncbi:MAG: NfeD family protein [Thermococci archaeon]|nr:NfeD family protein [Thermococci archaeon]